MRYIDPLDTQQHMTYFTLSFKKLTLDESHAISSGSIKMWLQANLETLLRGEGNHDAATHL